MYCSESSEILFFQLFHAFVINFFRAELTDPNNDRIVINTLLFKYIIVTEFLSNRYIKNFLRCYSVVPWKIIFDVFECSLKSV